MRRALKLLLLLFPFCTVAAFGAAPAAAPAVTAFVDVNVVPMDRERPTAR